MRAEVGDRIFPSTGKRRVDQTNLIIGSLEQKYSLQDLRSLNPSDQIFNWKRPNRQSPFQGRDGRGSGHRNLALHNHTEYEFQ
jgi:hypothetical protein